MNLGAVMFSMVVLIPDSLKVTVSPIWNTSPFRYMIFNAFTAPVATILAIAPFSPTIFSPITAESWIFSIEENTSSSSTGALLSVDSNTARTLETSGLLRQILSSWTRRP